MRLGKAVMIIALLALLPVLPYAWGGYAGHDFLFHVTSWLGVRDAWAVGQIYPTWSAKANFGLGDPRFCFYPPVSLVLGGLLTATLPALWSPAAYIWLCFVGAGLAMYLASRPFVAEQDRLRAALLYMLAPYILMTALVRFAAAELLVQALLPLIALSLYEAMWEPPQSDVSQGPERALLATLKLGCLLGVCWITDVPAGIMLLYGLLPVAALCAWRRRSAGVLLRVILAEAIAGALAAFYLAPAWVEQRWISMGALLDDDPRLLLMFVRLHGTAQPNYILGGWLFAAAGTALVAACWWAQARGKQTATWTWISLACVSLVLQLPVSGALWRYLPELRAVQFPFRFLPLIWLAVPLVLYAKGMRRSLRWPVSAVTVVLSCFPVFAYTRAQRSPKMKTLPLALLESDWAGNGYMGKPEYVQPGVARSSVPLHLAPAALVNEEQSTHCHVAMAETGINYRVLLSDGQGRCEARLATYYYPYWTARDEAGRPVQLGNDEQGLLLVELPAGRHTLQVSFHPASAVRRIGMGVSALSLLLTGTGLAWYGGRSRTREAEKLRQVQPATL